MQGGLNGFSFQPSDVGCAVDDLALEIGILHDIEVHDAQPAYAGRGQIHGDRRAQAPRANAQHTGQQILVCPASPTSGSVKCRAYRRIWSLSSCIGQT